MRLTTRMITGLVFSLARTQSADDVLTDYFPLAGSNVKESNYRMVVMLTDLISGQETMTTTMARFIQYGGGEWNHWVSAVGYG